MRWIATAALLSLAACGPYTIDERSVFQPPPPQSVAERAEDLALNDEERLRSAYDVQHEFLGEGQKRIAVTLVSAGEAERPLIVHCGGNGSDRRRDGVYYVEKGLPYGDVLLFDYPGYGDSGGRASIAELDPALDRVAERVSVLRGERALIYWGHSLGGFVCAQLARRVTPDAMLLEATAPSVREVATAWTPPLLRPFAPMRVDPAIEGYDTVAALANFRGPVLVMAAGRDQTLPSKLSVSLVDQLRARGVDARFELFKRAGHSSIPSDPRFADAVAPFFAELSSGSQQ